MKWNLSGKPFALAVLVFIAGIVGILILIATGDLTAHDAEYLGPILIVLSIIGGLIVSRNQ